MKIRVTLQGEETVSAEVDVSETTYCELCALARALKSEQVPYAPEMVVEEV